MWGEVCEGTLPSSAQNFAGLMADADKGKKEELDCKNSKHVLLIRAKNTPLYSSK